MRLFRNLIIFVIVYGVAYVPALAQEESFEEDTTNARKKRFEGPILYKLMSSLTSSEKSEIRGAFAFWEANTCLSFKETVHGLYTIEIYSNDTYDAYVGGVRDDQVASAGNLCHRANLILPSLGVDGKSKPSRGRHLVANRKNAKAGRKTRPYNNGSRYDKSTSSKKEAVNEDLEPAAITYENECMYALGDQRATFYDIFVTNQRYGCLDRCKNSKIVCHNGGYRDPKNCDVCKCPTGYGGKFCNERPSGCGRTLQARMENQLFTIEKYSNDSFRPLSVDYEYCNYWIEAPKGTSLKVTVHLEYMECSPGCENMGVELKIEADQRLTGYRFCCPNTRKLIRLTTARNILPIISYTRSAKDMKIFIVYGYRNRI